MPGDARKQKRLWLAGALLLLAVAAALVGISLWLEAIHRPSGDALSPVSPNAERSTRSIPSSSAGPQPSWRGRGVHSDANGWMFYSGPALLRVVGKDRSQREYRFEFAWGNILDDAEQKIFLARLAADEPGTAAALRLTAEQVAQLKQIQRAEIKATSAEKRNLIGLFERYEEERSDRQKNAIRNAICEGLRVAGQRTFASAQRNYAPTVAKVRAILTPEQLSQVAKLKWGRPLPTSGPSPTIDTNGEPAAGEIATEDK